MIILCSAIIISLSNSNIINIALNSTNKYKLTQFQTDLEIKLASLYMNNEPLINGTHNITDLSINFGDYTPISGWINIINKQITDYTLYFKDFYVLRSNNSFNVYKNPNIESTDVIDISSFGAKGDGKTDDTLAIRKAVDYLNINGGTLYFPTGQYIVSVSSDKESIINIESDKPIVIDFGSSTVSLKGNSYPYYNIMNINKSDNVVIQNGFLMGDRLNHNYNPGNTSHCWGYGIKICNTLKCDIINMNISQLTGDGIVNSISERGGITTINNCNIHHCRRIGIQVADADVINISNSNIHYIGDYDNIAGVNPKSGIDLEPVFGTKKINDLSLDNTNISSTTLYGIVKGDNHIVNKFTITNCNIENLSSNSANIYNSTLTFKNRNGNITGSKLYNCYINLTKMNGLALGIWEGTTISDSIIEGIDTSKSTSKGCKLVYKTNDCTVQNTKFLNILGINKNHTSSIEDYGIVMNSSSSLNNWQNNTYTNCSFGLAIPLMNDTNSTKRFIYYDCHR